MNIARPAGWLAGTDADRIEQIESRVLSVWKLDADPHSYTPHDPEHFRRVEHQVWALIPPSGWSRLNDEERFLLSCAAWTHDIGMNPAATWMPSGVKASDIRRRHVEESGKWVLNQHRALGLSHSEATILAEVNLHHSRKFNIDDCSASRICSGVRVRPRLLAAYLRLADAMEVAHERVADWELQRFLVLQEAISDDADETLFHWIKSFVVAGIAAVPEEERIVVEFQIPETEIASEHRALMKNQIISRIDLRHAEIKEGFKLLTRFILEELREELESVEQVLSTARISTYHFVSPATEAVVLTHLSGTRWSTGLTRVVNYLRVAYSPNSSGTAQAALGSIADSLRAIARMAREEAAPSVPPAGASAHRPLETYEDRKAAFEECGEIPHDLVKNIFMQLTNTLHTRLETRSCHVELRRIFEFVLRLTREMMTQSAIADARPALIALDRYRNTLEGMLSSNGGTMRTLREQFWKQWKERHSEDTKRLCVLCFGNSATVADVLIEFSSNGYEKLFCYVGEGRPKTQHGARNVPTYIDAETYAQTIRARAGSSTGKDVSAGKHIEIQIVPDITIGTILDPAHVAGRDRDRHPQVDAVLFGANGIFVDQDSKSVSIAHTSGHLAIAATARQLNVPVFVIASAAKIQLGCPRGWQKLERAKQTEWIGSRGSGIASRLKDAGVNSAWNPREDHVPMTLVNAIVTELGVCAAEPLDEAVERLSHWAHQVDESLEQKWNHSPDDGRTERRGPSGAHSSGKAAESPV